MRLTRRLAAAGAALMLGAACAGTGSNPAIGGANGSGTPAGAKEKGGTVTQAWIGSAPNDVFPLTPATNTDGYNANLEEPLWPNLVYDGDGGASTINPQESLYSAMVWSNGDKKITNLKLQKLVYYSQAWFLGIYQKPLFSDKIEAWVHGPVVPALCRPYVFVCAPSR